MIIGVNQTPVDARRTSRDSLGPSSVPIYSP
jgi:hypothetical protein